MPKLPQKLKGGPKGMSVGYVCPPAGKPAPKSGNAFGGAKPMKGMKSMKSGLK